MIDIHIHILHGLDDGPEDLSPTIDLARSAVAAGTSTVVATPHIREDYPFPLDAIRVRARELTAALAVRQIPLTVLAGGEVSVANALEMSYDDLRQVTLGESRHILVESPYGTVSE